MDKTTAQSKELAETFNIFSVLCKFENLVEDLKTEYNKDR